MKVAIIRGAFLNHFECQNYERLNPSLCQITFIGSKKPIHTNFHSSLIKLLSPIDLPNLPFKKAIFNRTNNNLHYLLGLEKNLQDFDIAHCAETYYAYTRQAINAKKQGLIKKVISTCWEIIPHNNESLSSFIQTKNEAKKNIDHFICPTILAKKALEKEGFNPDKISVIPFGIDLNHFKPSQNTKYQEPRILCVARLEKEKGIDTLLLAISKLSPQFSQIKLRVVGEGTLLKKLQNLAKKLKISHQVDFFGFDSYENMPKHYRWANIFCLPSRPTGKIAEQFGMVFLEALASGLPIVTTRVGAISEVLKSRGTLVEPDNPESLAKALEKTWLSLQKKPNIMKKQRKTAEKYYNKDKTAQKIYSIYKKVLS